MTPDGLRGLMARLRSVVVGQERMLRRVVACLLAGGHCLLEGPPGVAKTLTLRTLADALGGRFSRIQFTPDLVPSDVVGVRIWMPSSGRFEVELGPVVANLVLADEINRAPAKVQAALLEVMEERQVTIAGRSHPVPEPFMVVATQNPIESHGVFELPEAQRDRFLMRVIVEHPSDAEEREILRRRDAGPAAPDPVRLDEAGVLAMQDATRRLLVDDDALDYAVALVAATRRDPPGLPVTVAGRLLVGAGPRATIALVAAARGLAYLDGRSRVGVQDVYDIAFDVLNHRLVPTLDALADGDDPGTIAVDLLTQLPVPTRRAPSTPVAG